MNLYGFEDQDENGENLFGQMWVLDVYQELSKELGWSWDEYRDTVILKSEGLETTTRRRMQEVGSVSTTVLQGKQDP